MRVIAILIFFIPLQAFTQSALTIYLKDKNQPLKTKSYQTLILSENCFKKNVPDCEAYKSSLKKGKTSPAKIPLAPHPAAHYCLDVGGSNRIAKDATGAQYDYCLFKDGSLVDSWSLYNKHHSANVIK